MGRFHTMRTSSTTTILALRALKSFLAAVATISLIASASAADINAASSADSDTWYKIKPPVQPDLTWKGITFIGVIDVSGQYERYGAPIPGSLFSSAGIILPMSTSSRWVLAPNQSFTSFVGVKVDEKINNYLSFISRLEVGFNPTSGELLDGLKTVQQANGIPLAQQYANGDAARAGQIFNGEAWAGLNAQSWGAIQVGRSNAVVADMLGAYDPLLSYGFSLNGYLPYAGGQGSAETSRVDSSIKYLNTIGIFRTELMYGAPGTSVKRIFQGSAGVVLPNFSVDIMGGKTNDSVSVGALSAASNVGSTLLGGRVFDSEMYGVSAKYIFDLGSNGLQAPDEPKFMLSGGYEHIDLSNPADGGFAPGHVTIGGYELGPVYSTNGSTGGGIVNYAYTGGDRLLDNYFITGKYQIDQQWSVTSGYYRIVQNSFGLGVNGIAGVIAPAYSKTACSSSTYTNCAGFEDAVSLRADYDWTKNIKLYGGITFSRVSGGLAAGYLHTGTYAPTVGIRYTF